MPTAEASQASLEAHRARWQAEEAALHGVLDGIEERLLTDQGRVHLWAELRERHGSVSALAARNLGQHAGAVAAYQTKQHDKGAALAKKNRIASRTLTAAERSEAGTVR